MAQEIGFLLVPGFALLSFAAACEPFHAANRLAGCSLYRLRFFGDETAGRVAASSGAEIPVEPLPSDRGALHTVFVCADGEPATWKQPAVHAALRCLARSGTRIGGISGGTYVVAAAGLLENSDLTIGGEHAAASMKERQDVTPDLARVVLAGDRVTCAGGIAALDLMHALIADRLGEDFAKRVSDCLLHTPIGAPEHLQGASLAEQYGVHHPALIAAIEIMHRTVEAPLSRGGMAARIGLSERQLDRLFREKRRCSFSEQYRKIRLDHAKRLLRQSCLPISSIATATGFSSLAHFSRCYRAYFSYSPSVERLPESAFPVSARKTDCEGNEDPR
ncbi:GlxA family transcriptional regulator [Methylobacterium sp. CM6257]